tara:strand:- start:581 stop:1570 length:990 start_codon:yes stop_codon:yes gene_type:complete
MKAVITGGAGFIGSHVTEKLINEGYQVVVLDNLSTGRIENIDLLEIDDSKLTFLECDISVDGSWTNLFEGASCVIHLAALADIVPSIENPKEYFNSNVVGTFNVLNAANEHNVKKFIYSASSSCYGLPEQIPTKETSANDPRYPYALTKLMGEDLVMHWSQVYGINAISLRFFNVYGTRSRTSGTYGAVFGVFLAQKLANQPYTVVGDGTQTRDFTYVSDVADAVFAAVNANLKKEIINIGSDNTYSINDLVNLLDGEVVYIPKRPGEPDCTWADISKAKDLLNWSPSVSLQAGVTKLIENIDYWKQAPVWDEQSIANATKSWFKYLGK